MPPSSHPKSGRDLLSSSSQLESHFFKAPGCEWQSQGSGLDRWPSPLYSPHCPAFQTHLHQR